MHRKHLVQCLAHTTPQYVLVTIYYNEYLLRFCCVLDYMRGTGRANGEDGRVTSVHGEEVREDFKESVSAKSCMFSSIPDLYSLASVVCPSCVTTKKVSWHY